mmetsp:Transcript_2611/g.3556  ORF Transcript_2611/g.3556 Transcript_2611/m.3556 type:complete len:377 (-) Transcript_2611:34-1164(-)
MDPRKNDGSNVPLFGMIGGNDAFSTNKYANLEDILADCFPQSDSEFINMIDPNNAFNKGADIGNENELMNSNYPIGYEGFPIPSNALRQTSPYSYQPESGGSNASQNLAVRHSIEDSLSSHAVSPHDDKSSDDPRKKKQRSVGVRNMTEEQKLERRERNREHAKRSRVRKKFLLESLEKSVNALKSENEYLRTAIKDHCDDATVQLARSHAENGKALMISPMEASRVLDDPDYSLVRALQTAQHNFVITDPLKPDNPIIFATQGFLDLTGYSIDQVLGRNCRFLQGPDTDPRAVLKIRNAIKSGQDTNVYLLNYRADGSTFWNQFFIAALRNSEGKIINYVGVQCKVSEEFVKAVQKKEQEGRLGNDDEEMEYEED